MYQGVQVTLLIHVRPIVLLSTIGVLCYNKHNGVSTTENKENSVDKGNVCPRQQSVLTIGQ